MVDWARRGGLVGCLLVTACGGDPAVEVPPDPPMLDASASIDGRVLGVPSALVDGGIASAISSLDDPFDVPVSGLARSDLEAFTRGDDLFTITLRAQDGLGPLYTRDNCAGCHTDALRGPGLVQKMSMVEADGITPASDQSKLVFGHTVHPLLTAGAKTPIVPLAGPSVRVTIRLGAPVLGRGYLEAVLDSELERVEADQAARDDAIHGRINHVLYGSETNPDTRFHQYQKGDSLYGRFGLKARIGTLDDFCADALQSDMGLTSPLRPSEISNPDNLTDDDKLGVDLTADSVNARAAYTRGLAIPRRAAGLDAGRALFEQVKCGVCHVPSLHTRPDYPLAPLADIEAELWTDLLLHDMGDGLADSLGEDEGEAGPRDWRTAPLIGLRFMRTYLHDGRAASIALAIDAHKSSGSEASESVDLYQGLSNADHQTLLAFVRSL